MRRRVRLLVLIIGVALAGWAFWWEPRRLVTTSVTLRLPCWRSAPLRIALIADLHAGAPYIDEAKVARVVATVNAARPDVIVLLGDYVVQDVIAGHFAAPEKTAAQLRRLHAPLGVFAVLGNHDRWLDGPRVARAFRAAGIHVIEDDAVRLPNFWIAGVSDYWTARHDLAGTLAKVNDDAPVIVITHSPDIFPRVPSRVCLTLAGHTHGGQVSFPILGRLVVPSQYGRRYAIGHVVEGGRHLFVTSGVGTSIIPVRFRVPPEVVVMRIESTATSASPAGSSP